MKSNCGVAEVSTSGFARMIVACALAMAIVAPASTAMAQSNDSGTSQSKSESETFQTFFLHNVTQPNELTDIQTDLRNLLPRIKIFAVPTQFALSVKAAPEDMELVRKAIADLDRARKVYRLTYTITGFDGGKRGDVQTYAFTIASGEKILFKQGSRVPTATGIYDTPNSGPETQMQYQDVGLHIEATVAGSVDGLMLRTSVEQSSIAEEKATASPQNPILRESYLEGATTTLLPGKPVVLGSLDVPGTTRKQEIEVVAELVK